MFFQTTVQESLEHIFVCTEHTNKQTLVYMSEANTPKTLVCALLIKLYKILLCFALGLLDSEIVKNNSFSSWLLD